MPQFYLLWLQLFGNVVVGITIISNAVCILVAAMFAVQAATLPLLSAVHQLVLALAGISIVLLCCGAGFGTMPSYNARDFGTRYVGRNYGLLLSAWGVAGLIGPIVIARVKDLSGSFAGVMPMVAAMLLACVALPCITRRPVTA
jgi:hypothetical protein